MGLDGTGETRTYPTCSSSAETACLVLVLDVLLLVTCSRCWVQSICKCVFFFFVARLSRAPRRKRRRTRTHLNGFLGLRSIGLSGLGLGLHLQTSRMGGLGDEKKI